MLASSAFATDPGAMKNSNTARTPGPSVRKAVSRKQDRLCTRLSPEDFLTFDGPTGVTVSPGSPRCDFFLHLGLHERTSCHRVLYRKMKSEAMAGMERLSESRKFQLPEWLHSQQSFNLGHITEVQFKQEVERIYDTASRSTKGIYEIVGGRDGNWVIRWMLRRVIQARLADEARASSSGTDTDASIPAYSPPDEYSSPTPLSNDMSPKRISTSDPAYHYSDNESWVEPGGTVRVKDESGPIIRSKPQHFHRRSYWEDVL